MDEPDVVASQAGLSPRVRGNPRRRRGRRLPGGSIPACAGEPPPATSWPCSGTVYPRVCGGTATGNVVALFGNGLSPRVRGNLRSGEHGGLPGGSIPACAGEPGTGGSQSHRRRVYPRVCGGTRQSHHRPADVLGLSPRVRGNPLEGVLRAVAIGSIPACAGEPERGEPGQRHAAVYPRVCGGTVPRDQLRRARGGLSPRVRGNPMCSPSPAYRRRSIPACAGEPGPTPSMRKGTAVYPRVCGGIGLVAQIVTRGGGLSPRVRGNLAEPGRDHRPVGSIPACAGEPSTRWAGWRTAAVYPRVCGGTGIAELGRYAYRGLSPRVRGNPARLLPPTACPRSIPACAGEPGTSHFLPKGDVVYPRVCGGTPGGCGDARDARGLSPRVRGNLTAQLPEILVTGSIPACAGEPR